MNTQEIIDSQAFRLLNHMIDGKAHYLTQMLPWIKDEVNRLYDPESDYKSYKSRVSVRTYDEGDMEIHLPVNLNYLDKIADQIKEMVQLQKEIGDLQRQKLRLLNDYDFTKGDDTEQKAIFG